MYLNHAWENGWGLRKGFEQCQWAFLECLESYLKESFAVEMFEFIMCWFYMEV